MAPITLSRISVDEDGALWCGGLPRWLPRPVGAVAGIAEAREDETVVVEAVIHRSGPDMHVRMQAAQAL